MDYGALQRILKAFEERGVKYAIFGAVALNLHGLARFTEDVDVFLSPEADNITALKTALHDVFVDAEIDTILAEEWRCRTRRKPTALPGRRSENRRPLSGQGHRRRRRRKIHSCRPNF